MYKKEIEEAICCQKKVKDNKELKCWDKSYSNKLRESKPMAH